MRILLIEDDTVLGAAVRDQIDGDDHSVAWVQRLDASDTALAVTPYDLVLLDLMLPDGMGIPFLRRLRACEAFRHTRSCAPNGAARRCKCSP